MTDLILDADVRFQRLIIGISAINFHYNESRPDMQNTTSGSVLNVFSTIRGKAVQILCAIRTALNQLGVEVERENPENFLPLPKQPDDELQHFIIFREYLSQLEYLINVDKLVQAYSKNTATT